MSSADEYVDVERLRRMADGETDALREMYEVHAGRVFGFARKILGDTGEAEEVVQDVFVRAWQRAAQYDAQRASPTGWLLMMTRSLAIDRLRRRRRPGDPEAWDWTIATGVEQSDAPAQVDGLLDSLRPVERTCLFAVFMEGRTHEEAALAAGLPLGSVKTHIRRGLLKLRQLLRRDAS